MQDSLQLLLNSSVVVLVAAIPLILGIFFARLAYLVPDRITDHIFNKRDQRRRFRRVGDNSDRHETLKLIRAMHPREFEYYIADILTRSGYKVKVVGGDGRPDGGVDIVARREGVYYLVQCKKYIDRDVGVSHLREFYGVAVDLVHRRQFKMIFVSTTYFTDAAKKFAKKKGIKLIDGDYLLDIVFAEEGTGSKIGLNGQSREEVLRNTQPACPVCTRRLTWRKGPHGDFVGCSGYPSCKYAFGNPNNKPLQPNDSE